MRHLIHLLNDEEFLTAEEPTIVLGIVTIKNANHFNKEDRIRKANIDEVRIPLTSVAYIYQY